MKLREISAKDSLTQSVVAEMMKFASILLFAEFATMVGNAAYVRKVATTSGGRFRALDNDFPDNTVTPAFITPALKILGDKVMVDAAHERRGADVASVRARELMNFARNLGKQFQNYFINGSSAQDGNAYDGLKVLVTGSQKKTAAANGHTVTPGNDNAAKLSQQKFLELIDETLGMVEGGADILLMDNLTLSRLTSIARDYVQYDKDEFGRPLAYYNGIPLVPAGWDRSGNKILPHNETVGGGTTCTSIYAAKFGELDALTHMTNVGVAVEDLGRVGVHYIHTVELDTVIGLLSPKAAARLEGIIIG